MMCTYSNVVSQSSLLRAHSWALHEASCGLIGQEIILINLWLKTVCLGICDFLSSYKATIFVAKGRNEENHVNSSVVKYGL